MNDLKNSYICNLLTLVFGNYEKERSIFDKERWLNEELTNLTYENIIKLVMARIESNVKARFYYMD